MANGDGPNDFGGQIIREEIKDKILRRIDKVDRNRLFKRQEARTRGHRWNIKSQMNHMDVRKHFFSLKVVRKWDFSW